MDCFKMNKLVFASSCLFFLISACSNDNGFDSRTSEHKDTNKSPTSHVKKVNPQQTKKEDNIPFKVNSQAEYNYEIQQIMSLMAHKVENIDQYNYSTRYEILCLDIPMIAMALKSYAETNPEFSDPKVSFREVVKSIEDVQNELIGGC